MTDWYEEVTAETSPAASPDWYGELTEPPAAPAPPTVTQEGERGAGVGDIAVASLADDTDAKIRWYAEQRGIPADRYQVIDGQIAYQGEDGKFYAENPRTGGLGDVPRMLATQAGPSIPLVTGTVAGIATMPVAAGVPGATLGAMGGQAAREAAAHMLMGQDVSLPRIGWEGAFEAGGQFGGYLMAKGVSRALASKAAKRVYRYVAAQGMDTVKALRKAAQDVGVTLTPAELTNLGKMRSQQKVLSSLPQSAEVMEDFYANRAVKLEDALDDYLGKLSPVDDAANAGLMMRAQSREAMAAVARNRAAQGSPVYKQAFAEAGPIDVQPIVDLIDAKMTKAGRTTRTYLQRARNELFEDVYDPATKKVTKALRTDLETLQNTIKEELDNLIGKARNSGAGKSAGTLLDVQHELLRVLDEASPRYAEARALWGDLSAGVNRLEGGALQPISEMLDRTIEEGPAKLFRSGPMAIREARARMLAVPGGKESWDAGLRAYLEDVWDKAGREYASNLSRPQAARAMRAPKFYAALFGDPKNARRLKAAMGEDQFKSFKKLMSVFEAVGRALDVNTDTAFKQEVIRDLRRESGRGLVGQVGKLNPLQLLTDMESAYSEYRFGKNVEQLAKVITSPDAMARLKEVWHLKPSSSKAIIAAAHVLGFLPGAALRETENRQ